MPNKVSGHGVCRASQLARRDLSSCCSTYSFVTSKFLMRALAKKPTEVVREVRVVSKDVEMVNETYVVQFAQNSSLLTGEFMDVLNIIPTNVKVDVVGSASVEGTAAVYIIGIIVYHELTNIQQFKRRVVDAQGTFDLLRL